MRFAATLSCVLALGAPGCTGGTGGTGPAADGRATVTDVVDGDTIDVEIGGRTERVRLIGIDTPETHKPNTPVECYGPEASGFTASILPAGTEVRLERDVVGRDHFGRLLAYVYLTDVHGDPTTHVNLEIVERGFARPMSIEPNSAYARDFTRAAGRAERSDLGLWAACSS